MPTSLEFALVLVGAYLIGGIPFGYLIGRAKGIDIRQHGSGNIGATNVLRTLGKPLGITCFALDFAKGLVPVLVARQLADAGSILPLLVVVATVAGHIWTPYLRFKGGKGIATSAGALMAVAPLPVLCALIVWGLTLALSRMVGLASVCAAAALPLAAVGLLAAGRGSGGVPVLVLLVIIGVLAIARHRANIQRILNGTEPKIGQKKKVSHENSSPQ